MWGTSHLLERKPLNTPPLLGAVQKGCFLTTCILFRARSPFFCSLWLGWIYLRAPNGAVTDDPPYIVLLITFFNYLVLLTATMTTKLTAIQTASRRVARTARFTTTYTAYWTVKYKMYSILDGYIDNILDGYIDVNLDGYISAISNG